MEPADNGSFILFNNGCFSQWDNLISSHIWREPIWLTTIVIAIWNKGQYKNAYILSERENYMVTEDYTVIWWNKMNWVKGNIILVYIAPGK